MKIQHKKKKLRTTKEQEMHNWGIGERYWGYLVDLSFVIRPWTKTRMKLQVPWGDDYGNVMAEDSPTRLDTGLAVSFFF